MALRKLDDIRTVQFKSHERDGAILSIYNVSSDEVPFPVVRTFSIVTTEPCERGKHAHKKCNQFFICLQGSCTVTATDGKTSKDFVMNKPHQGLLIPASIWATLDFSADASFIVFADQPYDESDYIRDYDAYQKFRGVK